MTVVTLLGVPWDASSSFQRGPAEAPPLVRQALWSPSSNAWNERGDDLSAPGTLDDAGDLRLPADPAAARHAIEQGVREVARAGRRPLILGGDHSITYPILRALGDRADRATVLHLDAHADLYDEFPAGTSDVREIREGSEIGEGSTHHRGVTASTGDRYSHACVVARVMEDRLASRLIQVGIRTLNAHQRSQAGKYGVEILGADRWREVLPLLGRLRGVLYVSLDLDVIEPMLAPGVSHPEPGGMLVRDVLEILNAIRIPVIGADIVEYNPRNDVRDLTARVAAKFVKELVGIMRR